MTAAPGLITASTSLSLRDAKTAVRGGLAARGIALVAEIDHAAAAESVGSKLAPLTLLMFGNPRAGSPLMNIAPTLGIDLPLKILIWSDGGGRTLLSYNDPLWLGARHGLPDTAGPALEAMKAILADLVGAAGGSPAQG